MADVAQLAGVSHQTVSRVLNGSDARPDRDPRPGPRGDPQLDYRPSSFARALVTGARGRSASSPSTRRCTARRRLCSRSSAPPHAEGYFVSIVSLEALDPRVGAQRRGPAARARAWTACSSSPRSAAAAGACATSRPAARWWRSRRARPRDAGRGGRQRAGARPPRGTCSTSATHGPPPRRARRTGRRPRSASPAGGDARGGRRAGPAVLRRRLERRDRLRARAGALATTRRDGRLRRPTTRWRSGCCARCTSPAAGSPRTSASSASTTSPRRLLRRR